MAILPQHSRSRRASDWLGFAFHAALAVYVIVGAGRVVLTLLPLIVYDLAMAAAFLTRTPMRASVTSVPARIASYGRALFVLFAVGLIERVRPEWLAVTPNVHLRVAAFGCMVAGLAICAWGLWHLRAAFSIEPQARKLTVDGPYQYVRHPIYSGYILQYASFWLVHPTVPVALVLVIWGLLARWSIHYEERVLEAAFPTYQGYRARVGAVVPTPRVWRLATLR